MCVCVVGIAMCCQETVPLYIHLHLFAFLCFILDTDSEELHSIFPCRFSSSGCSTLKFRLTHHALVAIKGPTLCIQLNNPSSLLATDEQLRKHVLAEFMRGVVSECCGIFIS